MSDPVQFLEWPEQNQSRIVPILKLFIFGSLLHRVVEPDSVVKEPDTPELMDSEDSDSELYSKNTTHLNITKVTKKEQNSFHEIKLFI